MHPFVTGFAEAIDITNVVLTAISNWGNMMDTQIVATSAELTFIIEYGKNNLY